MPIPADITSLLPEVVAWRHSLHQHPELDFAVERTAQFIVDRLQAMGCDEVVSGIGRTGVVGVIRGRQQTSGRTIGLRADMDALPIIEATGLPYASEIRGRMHACGHDGHTAMLLGAATSLCASRAFNGSVVVIFQPAEETSGGGREMVEDGMMERFSIDEVYGLHNWPGLPAGEFAICPGPIMASADTFDIRLEGQGGHAAMPHRCSDTTVACAGVILALQTIASRRVDPLDPVVVSITSIDSEGDAYNVIPQVVRLRGTARALSTPARECVETLIREVACAAAGAAGAQCHIDWHPGYPVTVNSAREAEFAGRVAQSVVPADKVDMHVRPSMGAEDFSYMLQARPGAFIFLGNGASASLHHPQYDFNDDIIETGCAYWVALVSQAIPLTH